MTRFKKQLNKKEFLLAKSLLEVEFPKKRIAMVMDRSYASIQKIAKTKDWDTYVAEKETYAKAKRLEKKGSPSVVDEVNREKIVAEFVKIRESLFNLETWLGPRTGV